MQTLKSELQSQRREMATKSDLHSLRADVASDMLTMQKDTREQIVGLRRTVVEYHSAVVGHGLIVGEREGAGSPVGTASQIAVAGASLKRFLADSRNEGVLEQ